MQRRASSDELLSAAEQRPDTIEQDAQRFEQLVDTLAPTTAQVEGTDDIDGLINPSAPSLSSQTSEL
jgi:hypothetical protein